jgi:uncharacterized repeat protein (TIGR03803 family)
MKNLSSKPLGIGLILVLAMGVAMNAQTPTFTVLHTFTGPTGDGANPAGALIMDAGGNLYGTTAFGGLTNCAAGDGCGTVFKLDRAGNETILHEFSGPDGAFPAAGLLMDPAGNLYGTTVNGGSAGVCRNFGCGTVFKLDPAGNLTVIHAFTGGSDGGNPTAAVITDGNGNLYGTTGFGGAFGFGAVFKIDSAGNETVLHSFDRTDGRDPLAALIMDAGGNLYGTTFLGGTFGVGVVFKLDPSGNLTLLHIFTDQSDGGNSAASLIMDTAGNLYGTTESGDGFAGNVFKLDPATGTFTVLHTFTGGSDGGAAVFTDIPAAGLLMDAAGNLYGAVSAGGDLNFGTVFKIDTANNFSVLHSFTGGSNGSGPLASLIMDAAGNLYGTASSFVVPDTGLGAVFTIGVQTPQQATQSIINQANGLFAQGALNHGQDNSMVKTLQQAIKLINAGKNAGAIDNLDSFISEVNDLLSSGVLTAAQGASLINAAQAVIARLQ